MLIKFRTSVEVVEHTVCLNKCINALTNYLFDDVRDRDLVGLRICNTENVQDNVVGISFRRRDSLKPGVVWGVLGNGVNSNARFGLCDPLDVHLEHFRMPAGNGKRAEKMKERSLGFLSAIKKSIVVVHAVILCLANALIILIARVNGDLQVQII